MEFLLIWLLFGVVCAVIANTKGRSAFGWFFIGLLFGPFGLVVIFLPALNKTQFSTQPIQRQGLTRKCPYCKEEIMKEAIKCKHCQSNLVDNQSDDSLITCVYCGKRHPSRLVGKLCDCGVKLRISQM